MFRVPVLTRTRVGVAFIMAVVVDALQLVLGPLGWTFADEFVDVFALVVISGAIGFHPLLLPTFALECLPVVDMLPTWTGCVAVVVALRKRQQTPGPPGKAPVIDV